MKRIILMGVISIVVLFSLSLLGASADATKINVDKDKFPVSAHLLEEWQKMESSKDSKKNYQRPEDLKGKVISIPFHSPSAVYADLIIMGYGRKTRLDYLYESLGQSIPWILLFLMYTSRYLRKSRE